MRSTLLSLCLAGCALAAASTAHAQSSTEGWEVRLTPYLWLALPKGDITTRTTSSTTLPGIILDLDQSFDDVKLSGAFTGSADVRYNRFGVFTDFNHFSVTAEKGIQVQGETAAEGRIKTSGTKWSTLAYWRAYGNEQSQLDLMVGVHYLKPTLKIDVTTPRRAVSGEIGESWVDPIIGVRGSHDFTRRIGINGFVTYGGGGDSDHLVDVLAAAHYRFSNTFTASLGVRYFDDSFKGDQLDYSLAFRGPLLGLEFKF